MTVPWRAKMAIALWNNGIDAVHLYITVWSDVDSPDGGWFTMNNQDGKSVERNSPYGYFMLARKDSSTYTYSFCINKESNITFIGDGDGLAAYDNGAPLTNLNRS